MAFIIIDEYIPDNPNHFDFEKVKNSCEGHLRYSKVEKKDDSKISGDTESAMAIKVLSETSPIEFLQSLQGHTKPARSDVNIINSLSADYGFNNGVINLIVDYVLTNNNNILSRNYCEKLAASFARQGINTTVDAINYLYRPSVKKTKKANNSLQKEKVKESDVSLDEINELLNDLEVKKNGR